VTMFQGTLVCAVDVASLDFKPLLHSVARNAMHPALIHCRAGSGQLPPRPLQPLHPLCRQQAAPGVTEPEQLHGADQQLGTLV